MHGKAGLLVQEVDEMVSFIARIDDIDRGVTRQHVEEHFSARIMAEKYMRIYQKVISAGKVASKSAVSSIKRQVELMKPGPLRTETALPARIAKPVAQDSVSSLGGRRSEAKKNRTVELQNQHQV